MGIFEDPIFKTIIISMISGLTGILASSGFWTYMIKKDSKKSAQNRMLLGLGHDKIVYLGMKYIKRGWISQEEYENLVEYLYEPYKEMGGNGTAERVMREVMTLKIKHSSVLYDEEK